MPPLEGALRAVLPGSAPALSPVSDATVASLSPKLVSVPGNEIPAGMSWPSGHAGSRGPALRGGAGAKPVQGHRLHPPGSRRVHRALFRDCPRPQGPRLHRRHAGLARPGRLRPPAPPALARSHPQLSPLRHRPRDLRPRIVLPDCPPPSMRLVIPPAARSCSGPCAAITGSAPRCCPRRFSGSGRRRCRPGWSDSSRPSSS